MDIRLYFTEKGTGTPLVLLHGNGEDSSYFAKQLPVFAARFRVIAVDTRGHGRSPRGIAPFTLSQFAKDLKALFDSLGISEAILLGFSDGGNIALHFALLYPQMVRALILNGANCHPFGLTLPTFLSVWLGYLGALAASPFHADARRKKELYQLMALEPRLPARALRRIVAPALVLVGSHDMIRAGHSKKIARSLQNGTLCTLPGSHFIAQEESDAFNRAVLQFLKNAESPDAQA